VWRASYLLFKNLSGAWRRITRRFTAAGMVALGTLVVAATLGIDTTQTLAYQLFTLLAALLFVSLCAVAALRPRFAASRVLPRVLTAGEPFEYRVRVRNLGAGALDGLTLLEALSDPRPTFAEFRARLRFPSYPGWIGLMLRNRVAYIDPVPLKALAANEEIEVRVHGQALRRGVLHLESISVARSDMFGLARAFALVPLREKILVLPRRYKVPPLALAGARCYQHGGVALASSVGDSEEFIGLRDYRPGDPLQRIHWKSFARTGKPVIREFQDEYFERHALVLDTFCGDGTATPALEEAVSIAASLACCLDTQDCLLDLLFVGKAPYCYTGGRGQLGTASLLEVLAGVGVAAGQSFDQLAESVLSRCGALSGCVLILIEWDDARRALVKALRANGLDLLVLLVSEREPASSPAWLRVLKPGHIQDGLNRLQA
jgi:uncharacterized protein (DUF58 family)